MGPPLWTPCSSLSKCFEPSQSPTDQENHEGETGFVKVKHLPKKLVGSQIPRA